MVTSIMCNSDVFGQLPGVNVGVICNILQIKIVKQLVNEVSLKIHLKNATHYS